MSTATSTSTSTSTKRLYSPARWPCEPGPSRSGAIRGPAPRRACRRAARSRWHQGCTCRVSARPIVVHPQQSIHLAGIKGQGPGSVFADARTTIGQCLHALLTARLADDENWVLLANLAEEMGQDDLAKRFRHAEQKRAGSCREGPQVGHGPCARRGRARLTARKAKGPRAEGGTLGPRPLTLRSGHDHRDDPWRGWRRGAGQVAAPKCLRPRASSPRRAVPWRSTSEPATMLALPSSTSVVQVPSEKPAMRPCTA
jgi:hypothetical protein